MKSKSAVVPMYLLIGRKSTLTRNAHPADVHQRFWEDGQPIRQLDQRSRRPGQCPYGPSLRTYPEIRSQSVRASSPQSIQAARAWR